MCVSGDALLSQGWMAPPGTGGQQEGQALWRGWGTLFLWEHQIWD